MKALTVISLFLVLFVASCTPVDNTSENELMRVATNQSTLNNPTNEGPQLITETPAEQCIPTESDMLGPYYLPGAPERDKVGEGYVLSGAVRSAEDCLELPGALIEFWLAGPDGEYSDEYRASIFSGENGHYRFESPFPPPYSARPSHIHIKVTADGYQDLVTQHYPVQGTSEARFDLVLVPAP